MTPEDREALALDLFDYQSRYLMALGDAKDEVPLVSIKANVARGNACGFLPANIGCHLVAETGRGKIESDFVESTERGTKEITKIDTLIEGGGEAAVTMRMNEGNIKIVEANP